MTGTDRYGTLDLNDPTEVARYERHFYRAYVGLTDNTLVRMLWDWDDDRQLLRTRIPYHDQVIYAWRDRDGQPIGYLAVNVHAYRAFQSAAFGFAPEPGTRQVGIRYCEVLNLMRTGHPRRATVCDYRDFVGGFAYRNLVERGFTVAYATCTRRRLRPYLLLGAELLHRASLDGEERFLLRWPIPELVPVPVPESESESDSPMWMPVSERGTGRTGRDPESDARVAQGEIADSAPRAVIRCPR